MKPPLIILLLGLTVGTGQQDLKVYYPPEDVTIEEGNKINLKCAFKGPNDTTISWIKNEGSLLPMSMMSTIRTLTNYSLVITTSSLQIKHAKIQDEGKYKCIGQAPGYHPVASPFSSVKVLVQTGRQNLKIYYSPQDITVDEDNNIELKCTFKGPKETQISWIKKNGSLSPMAKTSFKRNANKNLVTSFMQIEHATIQDEGYYKCIGQVPGYHPVSSPFSSIKVIGTAEPVLKLLYPPVSITVDEGGDINLKCIFKGPNDTIISWNKKDGSLPARARTSVPMTIDKKWFIMIISSLQIQHARIQDEGNYKCIGQVPGYDPVPSRYSNVNVIVRMKKQGLKVYNSPQDANVDEGSTINLRCTFQGPKDTVISWIKKKGSLSPRARIVTRIIIKNTVTSSLQIEDAKMQDEGNYKCIGQVPGYDHVSSQFSTVKIVQTGKQILKIYYPPRDITVDEGSFIYLMCTFKGPVNTKVSWNKKEGLLSRNANIVTRNIIENGISMITSSLQIEHAKMQDEGNYKCVGQVPGYDPVSSPFSSVKVFVQVEKQILRIYYPPQDIIVHEGSSINLMCTFKGPKDTKILWIRKDRSLSPMAKIIGRTEIENSINVITSFLQIEDAKIQDEGNYKCVGQVPGYDPVSSPFSSVKVIVRSRKQSLKIHYPPRSITVDEGSIINLKCTFKGPEDTQISWIKKDGSLSPMVNIVTRTIPKNSITLITSSLKIEHAKTQDEGDYKCIGQVPGYDPMSSPFSSVKVFVPTGEQVLEVHYPPQDVTILKGSKMILQCTFKGPMNTEISWNKKDGSLSLKAIIVTRTTIENGIILVKSSLEIKSAKIKDTGKYKCIGQVPGYDPVSSPFSSVNVIVLKGKESLKMHSPPNNVTVDEGSSMRLKCTFKGPADTKITWIKKEGLLSSPTVVTRDFIKKGFTMITSYMTIESAKIKDEGNYKCIAEAPDYDAVSSSFSSVKVIVGTRKQILKVYYPPQDVTVGDGNNINLKCIFIGPEDVKISWIKRAGSLSLFARVSYRTKVIKRGFILSISSLYIKSARFEDEGHYKCVSKLSGQKELSSPYARVKVIEARPSEKIIAESSKTPYEMVKTGYPEPDIIIIDMETGRGNSGTLTVNRVEGDFVAKYSCQNSRFPGAKLSWKWPKKMSALPEGVEEHKREPIAVIYWARPLKITDSGTYACETWSKAGKKSGYLKLNVLPRPIEPESSDPNDRFEAVESKMKSRKGQSPYLIPSLLVSFGFVVFSAAAIGLVVYYHKCYKKKRRISNKDLESGQKKSKPSRKRRITPTIPTDDDILNKEKRSPQQEAGPGQKKRSSRPETRLHQGKRSSLTVAGMDPGKLSPIQEAGLDKGETSPQPEAGLEQDQGKKSPISREENSTIPQAGQDQGKQSPLPEAGLDQGKQSPIPEAGLDQGKQSPLPEASEQGKPLPEAGQDQGNQSPLPEAGPEQGNQSSIPEAGLSQGKNSPISQADMDLGKKSTMPQAGLDQGKKSPLPEAGLDQGKQPPPKVAGLDQRKKSPLLEDVKISPSGATDRTHAKSVITKAKLKAKLESRRSKSSHRNFIPYVTSWLKKIDSHFSKSTATEEESGENVQVGGHLLTMRKWSSTERSVSAVELADAMRQQDGVQYITVGPRPDPMKPKERPGSQ